MYKPRYFLTDAAILMALLLSLVQPGMAYANDGRTSVAQQTADEPLEGDPYFTVGGVMYTFSASDCDPVTAGAQACPNPIQASVDFLNGTAAASPWFATGAAPDDGNIYVEAGSYAEDVAIDGGAGWNSGANTPVSLGILGAGGGSTALDGSFAIADMNSFTLSGFTVEDADASGNVTSIFAHDNTGALELSDIIVINIVPGISFDHVGDGIYVIDHAGDILLTNVDSGNNSFYGASLENRAGAGIVTIQASSFNFNQSGLSVQSNGNISLVGVSVSNNPKGGTGLDNCNGSGSVCAGTGNVSVSSSVFNNNGEPGVPLSHTIGLVVQSNGDISLSDVTANSNNDFGALLINYFGEPTASIFVEQSEFNGNGLGGELGDGLGARARANISLQDVTASLNLENGLQIDAGYGGTGDVSVVGGQFNDNGLAGLQLGSFDGEIGISGASIHGNDVLYGPDSTGAALEAFTTGNITVSDVIADDNHGRGALLENTFGTGIISVESSTFNSNYFGLGAQSNGDISFVDVTASNNDSSGANATNCNPTGFVCAGTGSILVSSSAFNNNGPVGVPSPHWVGFYADSNGDISLSNVTASSNNYHGAVVFNYFDGSTGNILVELGEFNDNGQGGELGDGLKPQSRGDISLLDVTASGNLEKGVEAASGYGDGTGAISVEGGQFNDNGWEGLELGSFNSGVQLSGASIGSNRLTGATLSSPIGATVSCSTVLNHPLGIKGEAPLLALNGVNFSGNAVNYTNTGLVVINSDCNPASSSSGDVHGQGNPLNGSLHADCHAAKGEVDPFCSNGGKK